MFCPNCGKELKAGDAFCGSCGNPIESPAANTANASANNYFAKTSALLKDSLAKNSLMTPLIAAMELPILQIILWFSESMKASVSSGYRAYCESVSVYNAYGNAQVVSFITIILCIAASVFCLICLLMGLKNSNKRMIMILPIVSSIWTLASVIFKFVSYTSELNKNVSESGLNISAGISLNLVGWMLIFCCIASIILSFVIMFKKKSSN